MHRNKLILAFAGALIWFAMYAYVPTLPAYAETLGADAAAIGIVSGAYGVLQIGLRIPLGVLSDRVRKDKLLLIIGFGVLAVSGVMFLLLRSVPGIIAARTTAGGAAAWWVIITTSYANCFDDKHQVKAQGVLSAFANGGKVVASAACAFAAQWFGYLSTFAVSLCGALTGLGLMFGLQKPASVSAVPAPIKEQFKLFANKDLLAFSVLSILSQAHCFALPTTFTAVVAQNLGASSMELGFLVVVYFIAVSASSMFVGSRPYVKMGGIKVLIAAFLVGAVSCVPLFYRSMSGVWIMQILAGITYGITQAQLAGFVICCVPGNQRGMATGIFQSLFAIGIFLGPILAGSIAEAVSLDAAYWSYVGISIAAAALTPLLVPRRYSAMC